MARTNARLHIAVIGAGLAGAACARLLAQAGHRPVLFDKSRGSGGRLSTRRAETPEGEVRLDHGAQYLTARTASFAAYLRACRGAARAAPWGGRLVAVDGAGRVTELDQEARWVGMPGMSAIVKDALEGLETHLARRATRLGGRPGAWTIDFESGAAEGPFERVVLTLPPEQLVDLLTVSDGDFSAMLADARGAVVAPCWAVMGVTETPFDPGFDGATLLDGDVRWLARKNSRPGQSGPDAWMLHAAPAWSRDHLEDSAEAVAAALWQAVQDRFDLPPARWRSAHRWRYALTEQAPGTPFALDGSGTVGCAGDWRLGPRAECAWQSGEALATAFG
jgi:renalase